jgi:Sperm-tail PG-rich repeat
LTFVQFAPKLKNRTMHPGERFSNKRPEREGLGPGTYFIKPSSTAPSFSVGGRFDSDVRSKDHLKPKKKDGPGPGSYDLPGAVQVAKPLKVTTFGKAARDWSDLPKDTPAPN